MEGPIPFKVFTYWNGIEKPEVRRFAAEKSIIDGFNNLTAKLEDTYPRLRGKIYSVLWKDEEGDDVTISSRDEMLTALGAMKDLVKLYVYCNEDQPKTINIEPTKSVVADNDETQDNVNMKHFGVICDGCEGNVVGNRYKCTTCKDFDLCSKCEAAGKHPEHCMMRIPMLSTKIKIRAVLKKCSDLLNSVATVSFLYEKQYRKKEIEKLNCQRSDEKRLDGDSQDKYTHHERHSHHDGIYYEHNLSRMRSSALETFTRYMNEYANLVGDLNCGPEKKAEAETEISKQTTENNTQYPFTPDTIKTLLKTYFTTKRSLNSRYSPEKAKGWTVINKEKACENDDNIICDGCKNHVIGFRYICTTCYDFDLCSKCEAAGLHPEHYMVRMNMPNKQSSIAAAKPEAKFDKLQQPTENNKKTNQVEAPSSQSIQKTQLNIKKRDRNTIKTLLNNYMPDHFARQTKNMEMGQKDRKLLHEHKNGVNSEAPSTMIGAKKEGSQEHVKGQPDMKKVKEAHIESALRNMTSMGFTNDGGWLTQLLESKDGNIAAVLELLAPAKIK